MPVNRQKWILTFVVALAFLTIYVAFLMMVSPNEITSQDASKPFIYRFEVDGTEYVGNTHPVRLYLRSTREADIANVEIRYRQKGEEIFHSSPMIRLNAGDWWAGEIPSAGVAERRFWYITAVDMEGASVNIPENAPTPPLLSTRWERKVNPYVLALHASLMIGTLFFLFHTLYYSLLILFGRMGDLAQNATTNKAHQSLRWGWLSFFLGGIPLGMYVSGAALGIGNAWRAWPFGADVTDTKTEILLIYFAIVILLRSDQFRFTPSVKRTGRISNRAMALMVLIGIALAGIIYAIPHSFFLQTGA